MSNKRAYSVLVAAALLFIFFVQQGYKATFAQHRLGQAAQAVTFDPSIKVEYGKPIKVVHVVDGDTIQLINGQYVRYIGIDTPEEFDPRKAVQCYAKEAAERNRGLVEGKNIVFYKDVSAHDKYARWLGFIYLEDGTFVNKKLIEEGYAFEYRYKPDISKDAEFKEAEQRARDAKLGLWSQCEVYTLSGGRKQTNDL